MTAAQKSSHDLETATGKRDEEHWWEQSKRASKKVKNEKKEGGERGGIVKSEIRSG